MTPKRKLSWPNTPPSSMTEPKELIKAFVKDDFTVTLVCPNCGTTKTISVASYRSKCSVIKVRCPCQTLFRVQLEFRRHYRKPVNLEGFFKSISPPGMNGEVQIRDLSQGGVGFRAATVHFLEKGHVLSLDFTLDDKYGTRLVKEVVVMSVDGDFIGCSFAERQAYDKKLGFYLKG